MVLGSDWFSTAVLRTLKQSKNQNISRLTAATKGKL